MRPKQPTELQRASKQIMDKVIRDQVMREIWKLPNVFGVTVNIRGTDIIVNAKMSSEVTPDERMRTEDRIDEIVKQAGLPYGAFYE